MPAETLEARTDDVLHWLCENSMIERTGESQEVKREIKDRVSESSDEETWEDEMPSWANSALQFQDWIFSRKKRGENGSIS